MNRQIFEEDRIIRALCYYYQSNEILLPVRDAGAGLPSEITNFYKMLLEGLNAKYMEQERTAAENQDLSSVFSIEDDLNVPTQQSHTSRVKKRTKRSVLRSRTSLESTSGNAPNNDSAKEVNSQSLFERKTSREIEEMLLGLLLL